jgi:hypothetical protein
MFKVDRNLETLNRLILLARNMLSLKTMESFCALPTYENNHIELKVGPDKGIASRKKNVEDRPLHLHSVPTTLPQCPKPTQPNSLTSCRLA